MLLALALVAAIDVGPPPDANRVPPGPDAPQASALMPCGLAYECIDAVRLRNAEVRWRLSFDPRRPAVYDIVHWRVAYYGQAGARGPREFVAEFTRPAGRVPYYRILRRERVRDWKRAWLTRKWVWRELRRPSAEYGHAALELLRVFGAAAALREGTSPEALQF